MATSTLSCVSWELGPERTADDGPWNAAAPHESSPRLSCLSASPFDIQLPAWGFDSKDDVFEYETARVVMIGDLEKAPARYTLKPPRRATAEHLERATGDANGDVEDESLDTSDTSDTNPGSAHGLGISDDDSAHDTSSWPPDPTGVTSPSGPPSPVDTPTEPEHAPQPSPSLWDSFQRFSFQKASRAGAAASVAPMAAVAGREGASAGGEPAGRAAANGGAANSRAAAQERAQAQAQADVSWAAAFGVPVAPATAPQPAASHQESSDPAPSRPATPAGGTCGLKRIPSPATRRRRRKPVLTGAAAASTPADTTTSPARTSPRRSSRRSEHEKRGRAEQMQQQSPHTRPGGAVTPSGSRLSPDDSISPPPLDVPPDETGERNHYSNHADFTASPVQWRPPPSPSRAAEYPDEGSFNFSASALSRGPSPSARSSSSVTSPSQPSYAPERYDAIPQGRAWSPTAISPSASINFAYPAPLNTRHDAPSIASGYSPRMYSPYHGSGYPREPISRTKAGESTVSERSHHTASTAHATSATERSSRATRGTSATSLDEGDEDEEPIVDEVMRMYEKGFYDDTDDEDDVEYAMGDTRPGTAASAYSCGPGTPSTNPLAAHPVHSAPVSPLSSHPPLSPLPPTLYPSSPTLHPDDDAPPISEPRPAFDPIPEDLPPPLRPARQQAELENRDSAKSMGDCEETSDAPPTPSTPLPEPLEVPGSRDRYGFKKANQYITREQYDTWDATYTPYLERRRRKWAAFMKESNCTTERPNRFPPPGAKTKRFIRKGIPPEWRGAAWFYYAGGPAILGRNAGVYESLVRRAPKKADADIIERDLHRTFPDNLAFRPPGMSTATGGSAHDAANEPPMISALRRVLCAFSIHNPRIGYCQSLNFIAGLLLLFVPTEEQAFWLLNVVTITLLPGTHETNLEGSKVDLGVLMTALRSSMPDLWQKLAGDEAEAQRPGTSRSVRRPRARKRDATPISKDSLPPITITMTAWFMSCFIGTLPIESTLRVWDVFFYEGSKTLFRIALAVLKLGEGQIRAVDDPMEMFSVVQGLPRGLLDANELLGMCFKRRNGFGHMSQGAVDDGRREMRDRPEGEAEEKRGLFRRRRRRELDVA